MQLTLKDGKLYWPNGRAFEMPAHISVKVGWHEKGWNKTIGVYIDKDGRRQKKRFWFGKGSEADAQRRAARVLTVWELLEQRDGKGAVWDGESLRRVAIAQHINQLAAFDAQLKSIREAPTPEAATTAIRQFLSNRPAGVIQSGTATSEHAIEEPCGTPTLYQAIASYIEWLRGTTKDASVKSRADECLNRNFKRMKFTDTDGQERLIAPDCRLSDVDYLWIDTICQRFKKRPKSLKNGKPIRPNTVKTILQHIRQFFVWCDDVSYGGWEAPRKLMKPFRFSATEIMKPAEIRKENEGKPQLTTAELKMLWSVASDWQKTLMLLGLFTGQGQSELAVNMLDEYDLDHARLDHWRSKTRRAAIFGSYWLPPELVKLLRAEFAWTKKTWADRNPDGLAFLTADGCPLVSYDASTGKRISDAVKQSWDDLKAKVKKTYQHEIAGGYYRCRDFLGQWMLDHGGIELAVYALSQSSGTVLERHYAKRRNSRCKPVRSFEKLHEAQKLLYAELQSGGVFDAKPPQVG